MNINEYGFVRVAAASPKLKVADCDYNVLQIKSVITNAVEQDVQVIVFPELSITSYSCGDLFYQKALQDKAIESLESIVEYMKDMDSIISIVGLPLVHKNRLYNVAAAISAKGVIGFVPKQYISNYNESAERRWFAAGEDIDFDIVSLPFGKFPISSSFIFETSLFKFGVEISQDMMSPSPPSSILAMHGAEIIFNLAASGEIVRRNNYRRDSIVNYSARCNVAYVYGSAGVGESTTDLVFSGACFIAENGLLLAESRRFSMDSEMIATEIDLGALRNEQIKRSVSTSMLDRKIYKIFCDLNSKDSFSKMFRQFNPHPFVPSADDEAETIEEIFEIQTHGLVKRLLHTGSKKITLGISGGLDSTLALLVAMRAFDLLDIPRFNINAITMPGFGTTDRTYTNAQLLMKATGVSIKEISIVPAVIQHLKDIDHDIDVHDITYENSQARERTQILMDYSNKVGGFVLGTGNLSELALGWATYNGDHMSMYAVNAGVPKTLVAKLVRWYAQKMTDEATREILLDILDTPISPELLPADKAGKIVQKTEDVVGPYELHDFFIYRMLRHGDNPKRIFFLAKQAFHEQYSANEILKWLRTFYSRFFSQQFKRSCLPDGPRVGSINLSPRGALQMPSDAISAIWLKELEELEQD